MRLFLAAALAGLVMFAGIQAARADYFVWRDDKTGMTVSYPDTWKMANNKQPDDMLTIRAPSGRADAQCKVRIRDDMRYAIWPLRYDADIQKIDFSYDFWVKYLHDYTDAKIYSVTDHAGFGRGYAGFAEAGYYSAVPGPLMQRTALLFASLYNDHLYILECSSEFEAYNDWRKDFMGVAKSVDFMKGTHELMTGNYHDFLADPAKPFLNPDAKSVVNY